VCIQSRSQQRAFRSDQDARSSKEVWCSVHGCSLSNSKSLSGGLLFGNSSLWFVTFLHVSALLDTVEFNMAVGGKVRTDATVGTVGSPASLNGSVDNNMVDDALVHIKSLSLSISLQVNEKLLDGFTGLFWPTTEGNTVDFAGLSGSPNTSRMSSVRNDGLVCDNSVHMGDSSLNLQSLAEAGCFVTVLVVGSQVGNSALSRLGGLSGLSRVLNHCKSLPIY